MAKTFDVYIAHNIYDIITAHAADDKYHGGCLHFPVMPLHAVGMLSAMAEDGLFAMLYKANSEHEQA